MFLIKRSIRFIKNISYKILYNYKFNQNRFDSNKINVKVAHIHLIHLLNFGDVILPIYLRKFIRYVFPNINFIFKSFNIRSNSLSKKINEINSYDIILIGGGGIFSSDSLNNSKSGFQLNMSREEFKKITKPILFMMAGYNEFYNSISNLDKLIYNFFGKKSDVYFFLRDSYSLKFLKRINKKNYVYKIPCSTVFYDIIEGEKKTFGVHKRKKNNIAISIPFDRLKKRYGEEYKIFFQNLSNQIGMLHLKGYSINLLFHSPEDCELERYIHFPFKSYLLYNQNYKQSINTYSDMDIIVCGRGHSQLLALGLNKPSVFLNVHPKIFSTAFDFGLSKYVIEHKDIDQLCSFVYELSNKYELITKKIKQTKINQLNEINRKLKDTLQKLIPL